MTNIDPTQLDLDRFRLAIELYGVSYYWLLEVKLDKRTHTVSGTAPTPDQAFLAAMAAYAGRIREAVTG